jgi:hypothetical protein
MSRFVLDTDILSLLQRRLCPRQHLRHGELTNNPPFHDQLDRLLFAEDYRGGISTADRIGVDFDAAVDQVDDPVGRDAATAISGELLPAIPGEAAPRDLHDEGDVPGVGMPGLVAVIVASHHGPGSGSSYSGIRTGSSFRTCQPAGIRRSRLLWPFFVAVEYFGPLGIFLTSIPPISSTGASPSSEPSRTIRSYSPTVRR